MDFQKTITLTYIHNLAGQSKKTLKNSGYDDMDPKNKTHDGFILLGFSEMPHLHLQLFSFFSGAYILCIAGNVFISIFIISQHNLHSPMYMLLGNLAMVDVTFTSIIIPRALYGLLSGDINISFHGCFAQLFFLAVGNMDSFLLAVMAFDRYAAVCHPLRYLVIMNRRTYISMVVSSWVIVCLHSFLYTVMASIHSYCGWVIHHFFCDLPVIMLLFCPNTVSIEQMIVFIEETTVIFSPVLFILGSYLLIIRAVVQLSTTQRRWKTFSTCTSHLTMVILFYSTVIFMYFRPSSVYSPTNDKVISVVYSVIIPMLNPFIYSMRNKEVKSAVTRLFKDLYYGTISSSRVLRRDF